MEGHTTPGGGDLAHLSFGEWVALIVLGGPFLASLTLGVKRWRRDAGQWLLQHQLLVEGPSLAIPALDGLGLDLPRTLIGAGLLGLGLVLVIATLHKRWAEQEQAAGGRR